MKLRNFLAMVALGCVATGFTACDDDDDDPFENGQVILTPEAAGKYFGVGTQTVMGSIGADSTFYTNVTVQSNGKFTITLPEPTVKDSSSTMFMPTMELKDMTFTPGENNLFTIDEPSIVLNLSNGKTGTVTGLHIAFDANAKTFTFDYKLQYGNMPFPIAYTFKTLQQKDFVCGEFLGVNSYSVMGSTSSDSTSVINILPQENGKYTIVFPSAKNEEKSNARGMEMPAVSLKDVEFSAEDNKFFFDIATASVESPREDGTMMKVALTNIKGSVINNNLVMTYGMQPGNMPFSLEFSYNGNKQFKK